MIGILIAEVLVRIIPAEVFDVRWKMNIVVRMESVVKMQSGVMFMLRDIMDGLLRARQVAVVLGPGPNSMRKMQVVTVTPK